VHLIRANYSNQTNVFIVSFKLFIAKFITSIIISLELTCFIKHLERNLIYHFEPCVILTFRLVTCIIRHLGMCVSISFTIVLILAFIIFLNKLAKLLHVYNCVQL